MSADECIPKKREVTVVPRAGVIAFDPRGASLPVATAIGPCATARPSATVRATAAPIHRGPRRRPLGMIDMLVPRTPLWSVGRVMWPASGYDGTGREGHEW